MRVLVDTSVWVDFFNGHNSPAAEVLAQLIDEEMELVTCGVIASEFLQGIRDRETIMVLESHFRDMDWLTPKEPETYFKVAALFRELRARGITIRSTADCLIAQLAVDHNALILSKDRDLDLILDSGLVEARSVPFKGSPPL